MLIFSAETDDRIPVPRSTLILGAVPHPGLANWQDVVGWQPIKHKADAWQAAGFKRLEDLGDGKWPMVLVLPGKSRDETLAWFAMARDHLEPGGTIVVSMSNTSGARRFEKEFSRATGSIISTQKHKCRAFRAVDDGTWDESVIQEWQKLGSLQEIPETSYVAQAGIFSSGHVDPGSKFLADHLPTHLEGLADLGAGWGYLSDMILKKCPQIGRLDVFEDDDRALACARKNLSGHEKPIGYHWHDVTTGLPDTYDTIVMNPPFHSGQTMDVDLGRAFLSVAIKALRREGEMLLVANRQLPYEAALDGSGLAWRIAAENKTYKLLFARKH